MTRASHGGRLCTVAFAASSSWSAAKSTTHFFIASARACVIRWCVVTFLRDYDYLRYQQKNYNATSVFFWPRTLRVGRQILKISLSNSRIFEISPRLRLAHLMIHRALHCIASVTKKKNTAQQKKGRVTDGSDLITVTNEKIRKPKSFFPLA